MTMDGMQDPVVRDEEGQPAESKEVVVDPRIFVNAFPKSGTHLMELYVKAICLPMSVADELGNLKPWAGTFMDHSWTTEWAPTRTIFRRLGYIVDGTYAKGHAGYKDSIEMFLWGNRVATLFVYRDLRDVAVSLTHHIVYEQGSHSHPEWYQELGFDGALVAVIEGLKQYSGVVERWNQYAGWLDVEWVEKFKFEDLISNRREEAKRIAAYVVSFSAQARGYNAEIKENAFDEAVTRMVEFSYKTDRSPTFRKGKSGGWRDEFTPEAKQAFKEQDRKWAEEFGIEEGSWLVHLGYEEGMDW